MVDPGSDGLCVTSDDDVTTLDTEAFGSNDPEGVGFCQGSLFVADGVNDEFYEIRPGGNGSFGDGDDVVTSCDTFSLGVENPAYLSVDICQVAALHQGRDGSRLECIAVAAAAGGDVFLHPHLGVEVEFRGAGHLQFGPAL